MAYETINPATGEVNCRTAAMSPSGGSNRLLSVPRL
jgi:hypothetical protein